MAITIPDITKIRPTTVNVERDGGQGIPSVATTAFTSPGPAMVDAANSPTVYNGVGIRPVAANDTSAGYLGMNIKPTAANQAGTVLKGVIVDGFAGVVPGSDVFINNAGAVGLSHTPVAISTAGSGGGATITYNDSRIGVGMTLTKIRFD
jgi:hypothetical protein